MSSVCRFPNGTRIYIYLDDHFDPHCHAVKGKGRGRQEAKIFWGDPITVEESSKRKERLSPKELDVAIEWVSRHLADLDKAYKEVMAGRVPEQIPYP